MHINILTIFPELFELPLGTSILGRALRASRYTYRTVDLRDFADPPHRQVDDYPYGGGGGMVLKPEPVFGALDSLPSRGRVILLCARGRVFDHAAAVRLSLEPELTLICGHYKDVDERVREGCVDEEISLGSFVVSGGEIPALAVIDAIVRLLPGVLGDFDSAQGDSFYEGGLGAPSYTRPPEFRGLRVPEVLLSGDHAAIRRWREA
ncbi:MAG: tRNA (guanosine(37)-N1)-methyltransferase TrmD, partial [Gemmatimonadetes bacterium]|nr:tRNA (guanosine(37)-N1)-methyltransferase TrmD [Gemmatimonadota bacterium]